MGELHVFVDNQPLAPIAVTQATGTPATAPYVRLVDSGGVNVATVDSGGRITANVVSQAAISLYTEATTSRLTSGNSASAFWSGNVQQVVVGVNGTALSASSSVVVSLQQQDANGVYQTLASSSSITAVGTASFSVGPGMNGGALINAGQGQYRFAWTITGSPASCSFQIGMTGR